MATTKLPSRESIRRSAAQILRQLPQGQKRPVSCELLARSVLRSHACRLSKTNVQLATLHLRELINEKASDLKVITHKGEHYVILSEWSSSGQAVLFATGYDAPQAPPTPDKIRPVAPAVSRNGDGKRTINVMLDQTLYQAVRDVATRKEWSTSQMIRSIVRQWHAKGAQD